METHEPKNPLPEWPDTHVSVEDVMNRDCAECVLVTIHGCEHYLHRTTAFALYTGLQRYFKELTDEEKDLLIYNGSDLGEELL